MTSSTSRRRSTATTTRVSFSTCSTPPDRSVPRRYPRERWRAIRMERRPELEAIRVHPARQRHPLQVRLDGARSSDELSTFEGTWNRGARASRFFDASAVRYEVRNARRIRRCRVVIPPDTLAPDSRTDRWITGPCPRSPNRSTPSGMPNPPQEIADARRVRFRRVSNPCQSLGRAARSDERLKNYVGDVSAEQREVSSPNGGKTTVRGCLQVVFRERGGTTNTPSEISPVKRREV